MELEETKKKGHIRVKSNQFNLLVETMERNPRLNECRVSSFYTASKRNEEWTELAKKLNSIGGAVKNVKSWQKCWSDKKSDVRKKIIAIEAAKPTGAYHETKSLSTLEERILLLIQQSAEEQNIEESESTSKVPDTPKMNDSAVSPTILTFYSVSDDLPNTQTNNSKNKQAASQESGVLDTRLTSQDCVDNIEESSESDSLPPFRTPESNSKQATPPFVDARLLSMKKPYLFMGGASEKLVDSQAEIALALKRCAHAMERQNEIEEKALVIKKQKADAIVEILSILQKRYQ